MNSQVQQQVRDLAEAIKAHRDVVGAAAKRLRTPEVISAFDKWSCRSWCLSVAGDCLVRVRMLLEQNFNFIETIGVVAVARYLFELSVWLHLFKMDEHYGLVYFAELLRTQHRYWEDYRAQLQREIILLKAFEQQETEAMHRISSSSAPDKQAGDLTAIRTQIDAAAARHFSLYAEQAKVNGYGFQSHRVEKKVMPEIDSSLTALAAEKANFDTHVSPEIKKIIPGRWEWRQEAQKVGLADEYDFIYTFGSKLLHATPASITTDQKNLELSEMVVFLKYINLKVLELIDLAREYEKILPNKRLQCDGSPAAHRA